MFKLIVSLKLLFLLASCNSQNPISIGPYQALICKSSIDELTKYIFHKDNGYLYFYSSEKDDFIPLNLRKESGFYSEATNEVSSFIKDNKLVIIEIKYNKNYMDGFSKIIRTINLNTLVKKTSYKNYKNDFVSYKVSCNWIDPKLGIK